MPRSFVRDLSPAPAAPADGCAAAGGQLPRGCLDGEGGSSPANPSLHALERPGRWNGRQDRRREQTLYEARRERLVRVSQEGRTHRRHGGGDLAVAQDPVDGAADLGVTWGAQRRRIRERVQGYVARPEALTEPVVDDSRSPISSTAFAGPSPPPARRDSLFSLRAGS